MRFDLDRLRELYQGQTASKRPPSRKGCPSPTDLIGSFEHSASRRKKKRIVDHISECAYCHEEFMILLEQQEHAPTPDELQAPVPFEDRPTGTRHNRMPAHAPLWRYAAVLLGLVLVTASVLTFVHQMNLSQVDRSGEMGLVLLSPRSDQTISDALLFRWRPVPGSDYYVLELFDEELLPIWASQRIYEIPFRLPVDVNASLHSGRRYFWMITAFSGDSKILESKLCRFLVRR